MRRTVYHNDYAHLDNHKFIVFIIDYVIVLQPCVHFARHSCMKGDDCPFDHQLSKYPCTNYASNGFCNRGSDCLFSHEVTFYNF